MTNDRDPSHSPSEDPEGLSRKPSIRSAPKADANAVKNETPSNAGQQPSPPDEVSVHHDELARKDSKRTVSDDHQAEPSSPVPADLEDEDLADVTAKVMSFEEGDLTQKATLKLSNPFDFFDDKRPLVYSEAFPAPAVDGHAYDYRSWGLENHVAPAEEPPYGMEPQEMDINQYNNRRYQATCYNYQPTIANTAALYPLRSPEQIPLQERVVGFQQLFQVRPDVISMIHMENFRLEGHPRRQFVQQLAYFGRAEIVILRNLALNRVDDFAIAGVRYLDLSYNVIADAMKVSHLVARCSLLEHLIVSNNPLTQQPSWKHMILAGNPYIQTINGSKVTLRDRATAIDKFGSKEMKQRLGYLKWDWCICAAALQLNLPKWDPQAITKLTLVSVGLSEIHVGNFRALRFLDVSKNEIATLQHAGLEYCDVLAEINLAENQLTAKDEFSVFPMIPSLLKVTLRGNNFESGYRRRLIYECINLRGTNRALGLQEIDGEPVTLLERIEALRKYSGLPDDRVDLLGWSYLLIKEYGHFQLRMIPNFLDGLTTVVLSRQGLGSADFSAFRNAQVIDASENDLVSVTGLQYVTQLRYLDLSVNPKLKHDNVLKQLKHTQNLEHILLIPDARVYETANAQSATEDYRVGVLSVLFKCHKFLRAIDFVPISVSERRKALLAKKVTPAEAARYAFHCAVLQSLADSGSSRLSFHPDDVAPGKQYDPAAVSELRLSDLSLTSDAIDLSPFTGVLRICLSHNRIADITSIGLERCATLRVLDVSFNQIKGSIEDFGKFLNQFADMEMLAIRSNPIITKAADRLRLIAAITRFQRVDCNFRVIDTAVSPTERVACWKAAGMTDDQAEDMKWKAILHQRSPRGVAPEQVVELDLSYGDLRKIDLTPFRNLEAVSLRNNHLSTWKNMGFEHLKKLRALDLRDNEFKTAEDLASVTKYLPSLVALGVSGNVFKGKSLRDDVIRSIPSLRDVACPLSIIDELELSVDELVNAFNASKNMRIKGDIEKFRFEATVFRKTTRALAPSEVTALDLSNCKLAFLDLRAFSNLKKLSLHGNRLRSRSIISSSIGRLTHLEAVDVGDNLIEDMRTLAALAEELPKLNMLFIEGNPGYTQSAQKEVRRRIRFLSRLTQTQQLAAPLRVLNGRVISPHERCEALRGLKSPIEIEELRIKLVLEELGPDASTKDEIILTKSRLQIVTPIHSFTNIVKLDLSQNFLSTLLHQGLRLLPNLRVLSVERNYLSSFEETMQELQHCNALRVLYLHRGGSFFQTPEAYANAVFARLRALEFVDDIKNPHPLTPQQWAASNYLFSSFLIGPNNLHTVDLRNRKIPSRHFWAVTMAIADLRTITSSEDEEVVKSVGVQKLWLRDGNFLDAPVAEYRFLLVYKLPTLQELDGLEISLDERANAVKRMSGIVGEGKSDRMTVKAIQIAEQLAMTGADIGVLASVLEQTGHSPSDAVGGSTQQQAESETQQSVSHIDYKFIADNADKLKGIAELKSMIAESSVLVESTGTFLSKIEIVISFFQILALLLVLNVPWPSQFLTFTTFSVALNLDFDSLLPSLSLSSQYIRWFGVMLGPVIFMTIYLATFNKENWYASYVTHWGWTRFKYFSWWFLSLILSLAVGLGVDRDSISQLQTGKMVSQTTLWVAVGCASGFTFAILCLLVNAWNFRRHRADDRYWMKVYIRYRQRIGLFLLTVFYMPVARTVLMAYYCGPSKLLLFSDLSCPNIAEPATYPWMWYVAAVFALLYIVGIPSFFAVLITRGVRDVETNYAFAYDDEQLKQFKAEAKADKKNKTLKHRVDQKLRYIANKYADAVVNWRSASSYLYSQYERSRKFQKIVQMLLKLVLLIVTIFIGFGVFQPLVAFCVIAVFFLWNLWRRPMADDLEDVMDLMAQFANTLTALIGWLLADGTFPTSLDANLCLIVVNGANVIHMVAHFLIFPIRTCLASRKKASAAKAVREKSRAYSLSGAQGGDADEDAAGPMSSTDGPGDMAGEAGSGAVGLAAAVVMPASDVARQTAAVQNDAVQEGAVVVSVGQDASEAVVDGVRVADTVSEVRDQTVSDAAQSSGGDAHGTEASSSAMDVASLGAAVVVTEGSNRRKSLDS
jgi:Leucine-rich repeat (LRR) protein